MNPIMRQTVVVSLLLAWGLSVAACTPRRHRKVTPVSDVVPLTAANLRGHKMLYKEGWFIITSTEKSLEYAQRTSVTASWQVLVRIAGEIREGSKQYVQDLGDNARASLTLAKKVLTVGTKVTRGIFAGTHYLGTHQLRAANTAMVRALDAFVQGNLSLARRTASDREVLAALPGGLYADLRDDFSNLYVLSGIIKKKVSSGIRVNWNESFAKASEEFRREYEESGTRKNSMQALGDILTGYLKAFYHGLARPGAKTIVKATVKGLKYGVFLPASTALILVGRTIQATGIALYHVTKLGIHLISPTVEGGFLAALGLFNYSSVPVIYTYGAAMGAFNQVAFTTLAPAAGGARAVGGTALHTGVYAAGTFYNVVDGTSQVVINQLKAGVVLGYNALTAIPAHLYLGSIDTAIFLAWDGPRLVIAMARGTVSFTTNEGKKERVSMGALPVGTVVDLKKLKKIKGVRVDVISKDPKVIEKVIRQVPEDYRKDGGDENP